jgi:hypothetical protein
MLLMKNPRHMSGEQLLLRVEGPNGGQIPLELRARNVGTPDWALESVLRASLKLRADGKSCWCVVNTKRQGERHSVKRCRCRCHTKKSKR